MNTKVGVLLVVLLVSAAVASAHEVLFYEKETGFKMADFALLAEKLRHEGFKLLSTEAELSMDVLKYYKPNVIVIPSPEAELTGFEIGVLLEHVVRSGGGLLLCSEPTRELEAFGMGEFGGAANLLQLLGLLQSDVLSDYTEGHYYVPPAPAETLANETGVPGGMGVGMEEEEVPGGMGVGMEEEEVPYQCLRLERFYNFNLKEPLLQTLFAGVAELKMPSVGGFVIHSGSPEVFVVLRGWDTTYTKKSKLFPPGSKPPLAVGMLLGRGRVLILGDCEFMTDPLINLSDNLQFALNAFRWLTPSPLAEEEPNLTKLEATYQELLRVLEENERLREQLEELRKSLAALPAQPAPPEAEGVQEEVAFPTQLLVVAVFLLLTSCGLLIVLFLRRRAKAKRAEEELKKLVRIEGIKL